MPDNAESIQPARDVDGEVGKRQRRLWSAGGFVDCDKTTQAGFGFAGGAIVRSGIVTIRCDAAGGSGLIERARKMSFRGSGVDPRLTARTVRTG